MLAWALWFGGMIALFLFVQTLFAHDRAVAVEAAPQLFIVFQKFQLILAAITLAAVVAWRVAAPSRAVVAIVVLLAVATFAGVAISVWIMPRMNELRALGESGGEEFRRLHGRSMMLFMIETIMLLVSGILLPSAMRVSSAPSSPAHTPPRTARATDSQA